MNAIFVIGLVSLVVLVFWVNTKILQFFIKKYIKTEFSFKKALAVLLLFWFGFALLMSILKESVDEGDILFLLIFTLIQFSSLILFYLLMQFSLSKSETASFFSVFKTYLSSGFVGALVTILIVVPVRYYIVSPHIIEGDVMSPALKNGDYAIFDTLTKSYQSGDIVVVKVDNSSFPDRVYLQRIIGLPNQKVEITDGKIFINDELLTEDYAQGKIVSTGEVTLGSDEYFVLVDKRTPTYKSDFMSNKIIKAKQIVGEYRFTLYNID